MLEISTRQHRQRFHIQNKELHMLTFEQAYEFTSKFSSSAAFEEQECLAYYETLMSLVEGGTIVEVGLQFGRSSSIALQVAKERQLSYIGIDPFEEGPHVHKAWMDMATCEPHRIGYFRVEKSHSQFVSILQPINAVLIDGDHSEGQVWDDLNHFLPLIPTGSYAMMHDYGRESLPEVYAAASRFFPKHPEFEHLRTVGSLGIWRRQ